MSVARHWGSTAEERRLAYGCDAWPEGPSEDCFRAVDVAAPAARCFRWLCQLRVAPYSYDWIDNGGRRSPQQLTPGLGELAVGQTFMSLFELRSFEIDREITLGSRSAGRAGSLFGRIGLSYRLRPATDGGCRMLVKLRMQPPPGLRGALLGALLPWGDLLMMRRQLLNLKRLAETAVAGEPAGSGRLP